MKTRILKELLPYQAGEALDSLGAMVSATRRQRGITQADLAAKAEVSPSTIVDIEKGAPSVQIGHWVKVLWALDQVERFTKVAATDIDPVGIQLMMDRLPKRVRPRHIG